MKYFLILLQYELFLLITTLLLSTYNNILAEQPSTLEPYTKYSKEECSGEYKINNVKEVPDMPEEFLAQGDFGTCFGLAATTLLQHLFNRELVSIGKKITKESQLSILDILGKGCNKTFIEGGKTYSVLYNINQSRRIALRKEFPAQDFDKTYNTFRNPTTKIDLSTISEEECLKALKNIVTPKFKLNLPEHISSILKNHCLSSEKKSYKLIGDITKPKIKRVELPPYNVYVEELDAKYHSLFQEKVKNILSENPSIPLNLNFEFKDGNAHAVVIKGTRKVCCNDKCHQEWNIVNSYRKDSDKNGWFKADSFTNINASLSWIKKCEKSECLPYIIGKYPFHYLIKCNAGPQAIKHLLKSKKHDPNLSDQEGWTPLMLAIHEGKNNIVQILLNNGADPNKEVDDKSNSTPLKIAINFNQLPAIKLLIKNGANPNYENKNKYTPLMSTSADGKIEIIETLIADGADPNLASSDGWTPLKIAISNTQIASIITLIKNGANLNKVRKKHQWQYYDMAKGKGLINILPLLIPINNNNRKLKILDLPSNNISLNDIVQIYQSSEDSKVSNNTSPTPMPFFKTRYDLEEYLLDNGSLKDAKDLLQLLLLLGLTKHKTIHSNEVEFISIALMNFIKKQTSITSIKKLLEYLPENKLQAVLSFKHTKGVVNVRNENILENANRMLKKYKKAREQKHYYEQIVSMVLWYASKGVPGSQGPH